MNILYIKSKFSSSSTNTPTMAISKTANLVLIPIPGMGHLVPAVELAKQLVARDPRLSITLLVIPLPDTNLETLLLSLKSDASLLSNGITFLDLPPLRENHAGSSFRGLFNRYMETCRPDIIAAVEELRASGPAPVAGFILDMFCTAMVDVATELGLPSYILFTSNAALLTMMLHLDEIGTDAMAEYGEKPPDTAVEIPGFRNPVPLKFWPAVFLQKDGSSTEFYQHAQRFRQAAGILVNTFSELESDLIRFISENNRIPPVYPVGPILNLDPKKTEDPMINWLDEQPPGSVVFLCFGSRGGFEPKQVREIAGGLEGSGRRFLWSLRRAPEKGSVTSSPSEFEDLGGVLPEGFLERTAERGRVMGWAPQAAVLAHGAVGAFVTHCGWNSTLESLWFGVPMAAWPMYAEQQLNAVMLVREMGLAAEIRMDYRQDLREEVVVGAAEVAEGIRGVMEEDEGAAAIRRKVKRMSETARKVKMEGGSSCLALGRFIESVFENLR